MHDTAMTLENVGVWYGRFGGLFDKKRFWALKDISFDVYHGETLGVLGQNGSGKSTLLRVLAGIIAPDKGTLETDGSRATLLSLQVGFIPHLTGRENALLSGILLGMNRTEIETRLEDVIEFSELGEAIDRPLGTYSAGMRARLGFSVAFQANPGILLIDEVLGVGDTHFREKSTRVMRKKIASDHTVVIVSHSIELLRQVCTRIVWIDRGETRAIGEPENVIDQYMKTK